MSSSPAPPSSVRPPAAFVHSPDKPKLTFRRPRKSLGMTSSTAQLERTASAASPPPPVPCLAKARRKVSASSFQPAAPPTERVKPQRPKAPVHSDESSLTDLSEPLPKRRLLPVKARAKAPLKPKSPAHPPSQVAPPAQQIRRTANFTNQTRDLPTPDDDLTSLASSTETSSLTESDDDAPPSTATRALAKSFSPVKPFDSLGPPPSSQQQLDAMDRTVIETAEQRAANWVLTRLDKLVWVAVELGEGVFWWPADILSENRHERPLQVELYLDPAKEILRFSVRRRSIDVPSHVSILSFRGMRSAVRFDTFTFEEGVDADEGPSECAFEAARDLAVQVEDTRELGEDLPSASIAPTAALEPLTPKAKAAKAQVKESSSPSVAPTVASTVTSSDDELLKDDDPASKYVFPTAVLALSRRQWWPGWLTSYDPMTRKFVVEWADGKIARVDQGKFLTSRDKNFFTVKVQETDFKLSHNEIIRFVQSKRTLIERILCDGFGPATESNALFFGGAKTRSALLKQTIHGDLNAAQVDHLVRSIGDLVAPAGGKRIKGSEAYESLDDSERNVYRSGVLLPHLIVELTIDDNGLEEAARDKVEEAVGVEGVTAELVEQAAYELACAQLDKSSCLKAVKSIRALNQFTARRRGRK